MGHAEHAFRAPAAALAAAPRAKRHGSSSHAICGPAACQRIPSALVSSALCAASSPSPALPPRCSLQR
ncbi:MAG: hypothetical protein IJB53_03730 [Mailhella sp.]|nr:hypothetical protein [Mailhella sp.]